MIVTGQGEAGRLAGFARALEDVLVKVSGDPGLAGQPAAAGLLQSADGLVSGFTYRDRMQGIPVHDDQGSYARPYDLTVVFDRTRIDSALRSLGRSPWLAPRPRLVMLVGVDRGGSRLLLSADGDSSPYMRDALAAEAARAGLAIVLPTEAVLSARPIDFDALANPDIGALDDIARSAGGAFAIAGTLVWSDEELGWIAGWTFGGGGPQHRWTKRGGNFDAAFRNAARGALQILSGNGSPG